MLNDEILMLVEQQGINSLLWYYNWFTSINGVHFRVPMVLRSYALVYLAQGDWRLKEPRQQIFLRCVKVHFFEANDQI